MPFDCYCGCPLLWKGLLCSPNCLRSSSVPSGSSSECGSAVLSAAIPGVGIGLLGVSFAFGLTVLTGACALGSISGGHFNPAVSVGLWAGGRFPASHVLPYVIAQVVGGVVGAGVLYLIASGKADFSLAGGMASNGYAEHSPGQYSMVSGLFTEVVMTFMFLIVILGATHKRAPVGFAGLSISLALTLIHLISIPVTNSSVNPRAQHQPRRLRRRLGAAATVAVLAGTHHRRGDCRFHVQGASRRRARRAASDRAGRALMAARCAVPLSTGHCTTSVKLAE